MKIAKPAGGTRNLGIPTVIDRVIQQAVLQRLQPQWDPTFSEHSYGFRPGRSAHQAVAQAQHRPYSGAMGASEIQVLATSSAANSALNRLRGAATTIAVRALGAFAGTRLNNGSRMRRESHVRLCVQ